MEYIKAKYTSVMLDFSQKTFEEIIRAIKEVVGLTHPLGITVEGELGTVGKTDSRTSVPSDVLGSINFHGNRKGK